jgi:hypothetical protein
MAQIARRPGDEEHKDEQDTSGEPVEPIDPNELVVDGPGGRRIIVHLPEIRPPREPTAEA